MPHFTEEQLQELATYFGLKKVEETLPVRDGLVSKDTLVWWRGQQGPEHTLAGSPEHWENIRKFPKTYQLKEPRVRVVYED